MSAVQSVKTSEFDRLASEGIVVVDFWAQWCGPCKRMLPELDAAAVELAGLAKFVKVDVDEEPELAMRFGVQGVPNLTILSGGQVVDRVIGRMPKATIVARVRKVLGTARVA